MTEQTDEQARERAKASSIVQQMSLPGHVNMNLVLGNRPTPSDIKDLLRTVEKLVLVRISAGHRLDMTLSLRQRSDEEEAAQAKAERA